MILERDRLLTEELPGLRRLAENTPTICEEFHQEGGRRSSLSKPRWLATVAVEPLRRSYSDHDTQKRGAAGTDRDDIDDGSLSVEFRLRFPQSPAGSGSCGHALLVVHLRVWLLQRDGVLFRVPSSAAVVVILARDGSA